MVAAAHAARRVRRAARRHAGPVPLRAGAARPGPDAAGLGDRPAWERRTTCSRSPGTGARSRSATAAGVLGVFDAGQRRTTRRDAAGLGEAGIDAVAAEVPYGWSRSVVVYALSDPAYLDGLQGLPGDDPTRLDGVAFPVPAAPGGRPSRRPASLLNPRDARPPGARARPAGAPRAHPCRGGGARRPRPGVAERGDRRVGLGAADRAARTGGPGGGGRRGRAGVTGLPDDDTFNDADSGAHYAVAWWACEYVADAFGDRGCCATCWTPTSPRRRRGAARDRMLRGAHRADPRPPSPRRRAGDPGHLRAREVGLRAASASEGLRSSAMDVFRTKSVEQSIAETDEPEHRLRKSLGALDLTVFGVGVIIGAGIFVLTGTVAASNAGPAVAISFAIAGARLRVRGAVLRRVRLDGPGGRQRLHVQLRHLRRAGRVDHRLGPRPGVHDRRLGPGDRLLRLLPAGRRRYAVRGAHVARIRSRRHRGPAGDRDLAAGDRRCWSPASSCPAASTRSSWRSSSSSSPRSSSSASAYIDTSNYTPFVPPSEPSPAGEGGFLQSP